MWHALEKKEVLDRLNTSENGLTNQEAINRIGKYGKNELKEFHKINPLMIFLAQFKSVFILVLIAAAIFSIFIRHYLDFLVISIILVVNAAVGFVQQFKAEKIIFNMRKMLVPKARVIREGISVEISSLELVPGDILLISEGDRISVDCRVIQSNELQANESVLTGESFPQDKSSEILPEHTELANRENMLYAGTNVVRGSAKAIVVSTGMNTEFGNIAKLVQQIKPQKTPLEKKLDKFSEKIAFIVIVLSLVIVIIGIYNNQGVFEMILTGVAVAVSVIPEGLPAVISITLAFAIKRMQKYNALIRKLPAAETLGRTTVICTDKTGTLTEEEMFVTEVYSNKESFEIKDHSFFKGKDKISPKNNEALVQLLRSGIMCNNARMEIRGKKIDVLGDPTEKALVISAYKSGLIKKDELEKEIRVKEYSFSSSRKMMSIIRKRNSNFISYSKGAPDVIIKKCSYELVKGKVVKLSEKRREELIGIYNKMASDALRVLGFAFKKVPSKFTQDDAESEMIFLGFQGMLDIPRKEIKGAIDECKNAGIRIKMITGDSRITAAAIAEMIDLDGGSIEGYELEKLSQKEFDKMVETKTIFARITPELKLRIIQSLKKQGEIVAVTGDGVNDALALKEAHIGVAMGIRGTEVTRDVSDIILLDDNFNTIVNAVREGRRVYDNMKKSIKFHLSANIGELFIVLIAMILALPLPILPLAILWMNLVTDSLPSLALSVEKEEQGIMKRKPINHNGNILNGISRFIILAGLFLLIPAMALFLVYYHQDIDKARTIALSVCVFSELFISMACRSDKDNIWKIGVFSNKFLAVSLLISFALQISAIYTPLGNLFGIVPLSIAEFGIVIFASSLGFIFFEICKLFKIKI